MKPFCKKSSFLLSFSFLSLTHLYTASLPQLLIMSADPALSIRPKYDQLIELLDTLVNWQKLGTFLSCIMSEHIQVRTFKCIATPLIITRK